MSSAQEGGTPRKTWIVGVFAACVVVLLALQIARLVAENGPGDVVATPAPAASTPLPAPTFDVRAPRAETYSNIYKYDYVGPEVCGKCHPQNYEKWRGHPHSRMNKNASASAIVGDFAGSKLEYGGGRVVFSKDRGEFLMSIFKGDRPVRQFKVTRVVGSRFVQMYIGTQTEGPEPEGDPVYADEVKLPFAYWIPRAEWFPQTYDENPATAEHDAKGELTSYFAYDGKASTTWKRVCIKCHNTYPYALRFDAAPEDKLVGFPKGDVALKAKPLAVQRHAGLAPIEPYELVTMGISCESCHFGGREHALNGASISFLPKGEELALAKAAPEGNGKSPYAVNSICHQCHAADPQGPIYPNGAASWNAREAEDLIGGACKGKVACTSCHNPHEAGPTTPTNQDNPAHVAACVKCHDAFKTPEAEAAHAGHGKQTKVSCLDCHMPRIVHGLAAVTRTHRISSPTDPKMLGGDYPNACNLCHLDKPLRWTLDALQTKWGKRVDLSKEGAKATLDTSMGDVWMRHPEPVVRSIAAAAWGRSPLGKGALDKVLRELDDESAPSRMFGVLALEGVLGRKIDVAEYTPWASPADRKKQIAELVRRAK